MRPVFFPSLFQSTLLQEERHMSAILDPQHVQFQSTLLQEERHSLNFACCGEYLFQSTLLQEERLLLQSLFHFQLLFQSTLLQEERLFTPQISRLEIDISIHAPTRGATVLSILFSFASHYFNPRSYKRSDMYVVILSF